MLLCSKEIAIYLVIYFAKKTKQLSPEHRSPYIPLSRSFNARCSLQEAELSSCPNKEKEMVGEEKPNLLADSVNNEVGREES